MNSRDDRAGDWPHREFSERVPYPRLRPIEETPVGTRDKRVRVEFMNHPGWVQMLLFYPQELPTSLWINPEKPRISTTNQGLARTARKTLSANAMQSEPTHPGGGSAKARRSVDQKTAGNCQQIDLSGLYSVRKECRALPQPAAKGMIAGSAPCGAHTLTKR